MSFPTSYVGWYWLIFYLASYLFHNLKTGYTVLKIYFHLQLLHNADYIPQVVQYTLSLSYSQYFAPLTLPLLLQPFAPICNHSFVLYTSESVSLVLYSSTCCIFKVFLKLIKIQFCIPEINSTYSGCVILLYMVFQIH